MQALMKRHRLWPPIVLSLFALTVALYALGSLNAVVNHFQYLWPAPAPASAASTSASDSTETGSASPATNTGLRDARLAMATIEEQLEGACEKTTLFAVVDGASVVADQDNATAVKARLEAINDDAYAMKPLNLKYGRLLYSEELQSGARLAMIDEKLAVALFNYADPIDQKLLWGGDSYRIVGIVDDQKRVGDRLEYSLYVPYRTVEAGAQTVTALCIETQPIQGAGGWAAFESATGSISAQGTCLSLPKEAMNAALPLRVLGCLFGILAIVFGVRTLNVQAMGLYRGYMERLRGQYAAQLMPWLLGRAIPLALGYAVCAVAFAQLFVVLIAPVYTFPEWIPTVLVEPDDIATAFWNVWQKQASLMEMRSPELIRIRFYRALMGWACGGLALTGGLLMARLSGLYSEWRKKPRPKDELEKIN